MRKRPLFLSAWFFLAGLVFAKTGRWEAILLPIGWVGYEGIVGLRHRRGRNAVVRGFVLLTIFLIGTGHMSRELAFRERYLPEIRDGDTVTIWGEIYNITYRDWGTQCYLTDCTIRLEGSNIPCNDILVYASSGQHRVGCFYQITGQLKNFEPAKNEGGFDSEGYYQSLMVDFAVYEEESVLLLNATKWLHAKALNLRHNVGEVYLHCASEKTAGFLNGMILGDKTQLDKELKNLFTSGGIAHILAISGLHMSIIGRGFYSFLRRRRMSFASAGVWAGLLLYGYCYMTGNGMSAIRAVGMMLIYFLGQFLGRSYDMLNALGVMMLVLLWENPFLISNTGFWFSVLALVGVGYVGKELSGSVQALWMSVGITLTTLPVTALCFYEIPLYAPIVNCLLLPLLTPIFLLALAGGLIGLWWPWLAFVLLTPCEWGLNFYEWVCECNARLPFSAIITGKPSEMQVVAYYVLLAVGVWWLKMRREQMICEEALGNDSGGTRSDRVILDAQGKKQCVEDGNGSRRFGRRYTWLRLGICATCLLLVIWPKKQEFRISFLDVGQGDGICIQTGDGVNYFIDGGSADEKQLGNYTILPFLKYNDIEQIDYWFVSHTDDDHISGLTEVLEGGYRIEHLVLAEAAPKDDAMEDLVKLAEKNGTSVVFLLEGNALKTAHTSITCLYPGEETIEDRNESSLVLELEVSAEDGQGDASDREKGKVVHRGLFTGDISLDVEKKLLIDNKLHDIDLYKAAHHGSKHSNGAETLQLLSPEIAIISCGEGNRYGHPAPEAVEHILDSGAEIYYTMDVGQITVMWVDGRMRLSPQCSDNQDCMKKLRK